MRFFTAVVIALFTFSLSGCYSNDPVEIQDDAKYIVVTSDQLDNKGKVYSFNKNGSLLKEYAVKIQDISLHAVNELGETYLAGERDNSNIIVSNRNVSFFRLLDEEDSTGSTAVAMDDRYTYSSMNGGVGDSNRYECLLVKRDRDTGETLYKTWIPAYVFDILVTGDKIYLAGDSFVPSSGEDEGAKVNAIVVVVDKATGKILSKHEYADYSDFSQVVNVDGEVVLLASYDEYNKFKILKLNKGDLAQLENPYSGKYEYQKLKAYKSNMYLLDNKNITKIDKSGEKLDVVNYQNADEMFFDWYFTGDTLYVYGIQRMEENWQDVYLRVFDANSMRLLKRESLRIPRSALNSVVVLN